MGVLPSFPAESSQQEKESELFVYQQNGVARKSFSSPGTQEASYVTSTGLVRGAERSDGRMTLEHQKPEACAWRPHFHHTGILIRSTSPDLQTS